MIDAEYVVPLRWDDDSRLNEFANYVAGLSALVDVTVVDGSAAELFATHAGAFPERVRHVAVGVWPGGNGKVAGVMTGIRLARHDHIVIADDDVRYEASALSRIVSLLDKGDVILPQNYFRPLPWHARWDTARSLLNRAFHHDYPGTMAVSRDLVLSCGGYNGDVLFENLELTRTITAAGGVQISAPDLFVRRLPPVARHFISQRPRQAYDSFAQPPRLVAELFLVPLMMLLGWRAPRFLALAALLAMGVAEIGRRRAGGRAVFPPSSAIWAPAWLLERGLCSWAALFLRLRGGIRYSNGLLVRAASSPRTLRATHRDARTQPVDSPIRGTDD